MHAVLGTLSGPELLLDSPAGCPLDGGCTAFAGQRPF
jgi:hypothetical protein